MPARNPRPLLQAIALPVHQVLPATADIQKLADLVDGCIGDETAPGQAPQRQETVLTLTGWLDPGDVGSRMHLHVRWQPQTHHINHPVDLEWSNKPWCQLVGPGGGCSLQTARPSAQVSTPALRSSTSSPGFVPGEGSAGETHAPVSIRSGSGAG